MQLVDTHCHVHSQDYPLSVDQVEQRAGEAGVTRLICVGTDADDSRRAVEFVQNRPNHWASIGIHPHEAKHGEAELQKLASLLTVERVPDQVAGDASGRTSALARASAPLEAKQGKHQLPQAVDGTRDGHMEKPEASVNSEAARLSKRLPVTPINEAVDYNQGEKPRVASGGAAPKNVFSIEKNFRGGPDDRTRGMATRKIIAIGECGLDYFYGHSPKADQHKALRFQIELALEHDLPLIFHVRDAFDDFWPIFDNYQGLRGVLHSFTDSRQNLDQALGRNLLVGINGITTFTKNSWQLENAKAIPLDHLLLETDAPFLTPVPYRGKVNEPAHVRCIAEFLAQLRGQSIEEVANVTTHNARQLFSI